MYRAALSAGVAAGLVCLVMGSLLVVNYLQLRRSDPLNNPELVRLRERFAADPGNADLKEQIRVLQLMSRKAFFTSRDQVRRGGFVLLAFVAILLVSLNAVDSLREKLPDLSRAPPADSVWVNMAVRRKAMAWCGVAIVVAGLAAGILTPSELDRAPAPKEPDRPPVAPAGAGDNIPQPDPATRVGLNEAFLAQWPNFRGAAGSGVAFVKSAPGAWDGRDGRGIVWKSEVPKTGYSSPVVWDDRLYLTGGDEAARTVYCYDAGSGELLWERDVVDVPGARDELPEIDENAGWAASTASTDGSRVFAIFATGNLVCFDREGERVWARATGVPQNHYAHSSSLLVHDNTLFVQIDDNSLPRVLALDTATGKERWTAERWALSWASPMWVEAAGRLQVVLVDSAAVAGYDFAAGTLLWKQECMSGEVAASATYGDGMVFVGNDMAVAAGIALEPAGEGVNAAVKWKYEDSLPDVASPLAANGYVIMGLSSGYLVCLAAATGEVAWEQEFDHGFYASPLLVAGDVYALEMSGVMHVVKPGQEYVEQAAYELGEEVSATPAVMEGRMYIRGERHLFCVGE